MKLMNRLINWMEQNANRDYYLFLLQNSRALFPDLSDIAFKTLLSRAVKSKFLHRVCHGLYTYKPSQHQTGLILFHSASLLRANEFNYISLETVLSDVGIISQIPMNWISIMSSGRTNIISCGEFGTIEFIHTTLKPNHIMDQLHYETSCRLLRASVKQALRDMKATHRNGDLIHFDTENDPI